MKPELYNYLSNKARAVLSELVSMAIKDPNADENKISDLEAKMVAFIMASQDAMSALHQINNKVWHAEQAAKRAQEALLEA